MNERAERYLDEMEQLIAQYGWALQAVFPTEAGHPGWTYTIGLGDVAMHPEFIILGLPNQVSGVILNELGDRVRAGKVFHHGEVISDVLEDHDLTLVTVADTTQDYFGVGRRLRSTFRALQVVWPDAEDNFPWDPDYFYDEWVQPLLGERP